MGIIRRSRIWVSALLALLLVLAALPTALHSQAAPGDRTTVASGLINPRFVTVAPDGTLYVTEAGNGGAEVLPPNPDGPPGPPATRGYSGRVTKVAPGGAQSVLTGGLPSYSEGVGPTGVVYAAGALWITVGGAAALAGLDPLNYEGTILRIDPTTGIVNTTADIRANEVANNPDGTDINPNPYGLALAADGQLYAADAGGNTIYRLNPTTWELTLAKILPLVPAAPSASPTLHAVPTGVSADLAGNVLIGELPGELTPGAGQVVRLAPDGTLTTVASGLTTVTGVAVGPDKQVYVSQLFGGFGENGPTPGNVVRVLPNGTTQVVAADLPAPQGIAFDAAGNLFVATNTASFGPPPPTPNGEVVRIAGVATPATVTFSDVSSTTPGAEAINYFAARDVLRGPGDGTFRPNDPLLRAQLAAIETRAFLWSDQNRSNPFTDQGVVDAELWRAVGILAFYDVARGYPDGTYDPTGQVLNIQAISLITRAMVAKGFWITQDDDPTLFPNITPESGHRLDVLTYYHYVGAVPGAGAPTGSWSAATDTASRAYFAEALYRAYRSYFAANPLP
ncbi:MAG TPA: ScyD/ScyE family protein [Thermomicrobiales bacterium]|jgi:sugar lactone lactonase YvrE